MRGYLVLVWFCFSVVTQLHAVTWYVDCTRPSDDGDGQTWESAKKNIQSAIDCAASNDCVLVKKGIYSPIRVRNKILTIQSTDGLEETFIDARYDRPCVICNSTNSVVHGFTIQNGTGGESMEGLSWDGNQYEWGSAGGVVGATVINCRIRNNTQYTFDNYSAGGAIFCVLLNCVLVKNSTDFYGGAASFCTLTQCAILRNRASTGGGTYACTLSRCQILDNVAVDGGGTAYSTLDNCVVVRNLAQSRGGVIASGFQVSSCTISLNSSWDGSGCIDQGGQLNNSIVYGNMPYDLDSIDAESVKGCYIGCCKNGYYRSDHPQFVDSDGMNFQLMADSPCLNQGQNDLAIQSGVDYQGEPRIQAGTIDIGAYEGSASGICVATRVHGSGVLVPQSPVIEVGSSVTFHAIESMRPFVGFVTNGVVATTNKILTIEAVTTNMTVGAIFQSIDVFVDRLKNDDYGDGLSWSTAKQTIQAAVDMAVDGDRVRVKAGVYRPFRVMNKSIQIESENVGGAVVDGMLDSRSERELADAIDHEVSAHPWFVPPLLLQQRCALLGIVPMQTNVVLRGFMLKNGIAGDLCYQANFDAISLEYIDSGYALLGSVIGYGGAVYGGTLENCTMLNCSGIYGGGAYGSLLKACTVSQNCATNGGGVCAAQLIECTLMDNRASNGGGAYDSRLHQCTLAFNRAAENGGGALGGRCTSSTIVDNQASCGGGVYGGTVYASLLQNNFASLLGGNAYGATIEKSEVEEGDAAYGGGLALAVAVNSRLIANRAVTGGGTYFCSQTNCLVVLNVATFLGGGIYYGDAVNATVANNVASRMGGGCFGGGLINSIIWDNAVESGVSSNYYNCALQSCCSFPLSAANGNTNEPPQFVGNGDYRLLSSSPCIDYGDNRFASVTADLAGRPRIQNSCVDLGAYEFWPSIEVAGVAVTNTFSSSFLLLTPQSNVWRAVASYMDQNPVLTADALGGKLVNADMFGLTMNDLSVNDNLQNFDPAVTIVQVQANTATSSLLSAGKPFTLTFSLSNGLMPDRDALLLFRRCEQRCRISIEVYDQIPAASAQPVETLQPIALTYDETNGTASATVQSVQSYAQAYFRLKMAHLVVDSTAAQ